MKRIAAIVALALTSGCGVRPTGVISTGDPPVAQQAVPQATIYLVRQNRLIPVHRAAMPGAPQAAVMALWGPQTADEARQGLLDPAAMLSDPQVTFSSGSLVISYRDFTPASPLTIAQLVCSGTTQPGVQSLRLVRNGVDIKPTNCARYSQYMAR